MQGHPTTRAEWVALAKKVEHLGFETLSIADHPGTTASPFVALAAAGQVTERLKLATAVANAGAWEPLALAAEIATLDVLADGRAVLGIGAGHTPAEWLQVGKAYPSPSERLAHLEAMVVTVGRLLAGETVTVDSDTFMLRDAVLNWPARPRGDIPVLIGGNALELVRIAVRHADTVEITGLGRTLADGHTHKPEWSAAAVDARAGILPAGDGRPSLGALVQRVEITDDRTGVAEAFRSRLSEAMDESDLPSIGEILETPFLLVGTEDEIVAQLETNRRRWGFSRYTVRADTIDYVARIIERLGP